MACIALRPFVADVNSVFERRDLAWLCLFGGRSYLQNWQICVLNGTLGVLHDQERGKRCPLPNGIDARPAEFADYRVEEFEIRQISYLLISQ